ncbi:hypothetical protein BO94DRAFT_24264 [Aspergillus sclerotioniger CBS 115572]|uniref:Uncharacterized protein n=1 Tax=Aspergillus sclerotioniger CBS 115572 TaxID=1450535 RepID=A0A317X1K0_9EURO|nr:hypothetical protein BO94DRAFT_24264 [Aspergillus sclerotioniger CBS 115572]PWY90420.1 hypothetical protein BO94DRAFT_24264 [Aspergillus sclerotioniger CBS 115572]
MRFWANSYDRTYAVWNLPGAVNGISDLEKYVRSFDWPPSEDVQKEYEVPAGVRMGLLFDYLSCDLNLSRWMLMWGPKAPISLVHVWGDAFAEVYERAAAEGGLVIMTDEVIWSRSYKDLPWTSNVTNPRNNIVAEYQQLGLIRPGGKDPSYIMRVKPVGRGHFGYPPPLDWVEPEQVPEPVELPALHTLQLSHSNEDLLVTGH